MIKTLFENTKGLIELRALPSRSRVFVRSGGHTLFCRKHCREDLYFGVATRDGHGGRKENIVSIPAVWVDIDFKDTPINEARGLLRRFPFKPTFTLMSGGGVHLYWKLKEPAGMDDIEAVEGINKRIVAALKGDATGTEAARILRVPGSMNFKYNPPRPVKVVKYNAFEYTLEAFEILPEVHHKRPAMIPEQLQAIPAILPECIRFIIEKAPHDVSRGRSFNALVVQLVVYFQAAGFALGGALALSATFIATCGSSTYQTQLERERHFRHIWEKLPEYGYAFGCSYILGLKLPGYAFDCRQCVLNKSRANEEQKNTK